MKVLAIIGVRSGSKSITDKNLSRILNLNLLELVIRKAKQIPEILAVCCSSDSPDYLNIAEQYGADYLIRRPDDLSEDNSSEYEYISHALNCINEEFDIIVRLQATSPFQKQVSIKAIINKLIKNQVLDSVQLVTETTPNVAKAMTISQDTNFLQPAVSWGNIAPTNRQAHVKSFMRSNAYAVRVKSMSETHLLGRKSGYILGDDIESIDIDSPLDLLISQCIAAREPTYLDLIEGN